MHKNDPLTNNTTEKNTTSNTNKPVENEWLKKILPSGVLTNVGEYLSGKDLASASQVCKYFNSTIRSNTFFAEKMNKEKESTQPKALIEKYRKFVEEEVRATVTDYKINKDDSNKIDSVDFYYAKKNGAMTFINYGWSMITDAISEDTNISYLRK